MEDGRRGEGNRSVELATSLPLKCKQLGVVQPARKF